MTDNQFNWTDAKQLNLFQIFLAFAIPSAMGLFGFHILLPQLFNGGLAAVVAWPLIASVMLLAFTLVPLMMMKSEAKNLRISLKSRMCLTTV